MIHNDSRELYSETNSLYSSFYITGNTVSCYIKSPVGRARVRSGKFTEFVRKKEEFLSKIF